jgi:hypothetical protein
MTVLIESQSPIPREQIYDSQTGLNVLNAIKQVLEQDEFGLFKLKSKADFDKKISQSNRDIEKLVNVKSRAAEQINLITDELQKLKSDNQQRLQIVGGLLDAN